MPSPASCWVENSMKICSSWAPMISIFDTSGTCSNRERTVLDVVAQLAMAEAVGGEAVDQAERVAEVVVEARTDHAGRQRVADVADVLAHLVPDVGNLGRRRRSLEIDEDRRQPGRRIAAQEIEARASPAACARSAR